MSAPKHETQKQLEQILASLPPDTPENVDVREDLLVDARKLLLALERPDNIVERLCFGIWETIAVKVAMDLKIFELLEKKSPQTAQEITAATSGDPMLINRLLRCLGAHGALTETEDGSYATSTVSRTFADPRHQAAMEALYGYMIPGWIYTPSFLQDTQYKNPESGTHTVFAKAYDKPNGATVWELLSASPYMGAMNRYMMSYNDGHRNWMDIYPVEERLASGLKTDDDAVLMVDCGGGHGHQASAFRQRFPKLQGRCIVEDLPHGLPPEKLPGIEYVAHDLTAEQPIKGARFYYLRYVIHDWPQKWCAQVLSNIRKVMTPGYSKILVNEWVVPERGASKFMTSNDLNMMSFGGGMERTLPLHQEYVEQAGLKITGVWSPHDKISESVIELDIA